MAADFPELIVRDHGSLVDALRAAKEHLQISNETLEALAGLCAGHVDKLFNGEKRVGPLVLGLVCEALGVDLSCAKIGPRCKSWRIGGNGATNAKCASRAPFRRPRSTAADRSS
jgi:hypothetical protein